MNIDDIIENAQLKGRVIGLEAQVETLTAEIRCLEAVIRSHERIDCLSVTSLKKQLTEADAENARLKAEVEKWEKNTQLMGRQLNDELEQVARLNAEVERLDDELKMEKENEDRLVREFQRANNEVYGLQRQVAALIDDQTRLNSLIANIKDDAARKIHGLQQDNETLQNRVDFLEG